MAVKEDTKKLAAKEHTKELAEANKFAQKIASRE
jgi:hypothetical protein